MWREMSTFRGVCEMGQLQQRMTWGLRGQMYPEKTGRPGTADVLEPRLHCTR